MRVVVLAKRRRHEQARDFYERESGIGDYCADSLVADIESLALYHGIIPVISGFTSRGRFGYYRETETETQASRWI